MFMPDEPVASRSSRQPHLAGQTVLVAGVAPFVDGDTVRCCKDNG
jgi:hypothetical protein